MDEPDSSSATGLRCQASAISAASSAERLGSQDRLAAVHAPHVRRARRVVQHLTGGEGRFPAGVARRRSRRRACAAGARSSGHSAGISSAPTRLSSTDISAALQKCGTMTSISSLAIWSTSRVPPTRANGLVKQGPAHHRRVQEPLVARHREPDHRQRGQVRIGRGHRLDGDDGVGRPALRALQGEHRGALPPGPHGVDQPGQRVLLLGVPEVRSPQFGAEQFAGGAAEEPWARAGRTAGSGRTGRCRG